MKRTIVTYKLIKRVDQFYVLPRPVHVRLLCHIAKDIIYVIIFAQIQVVPFLTSYHILFGRVSTL